MAPGLNTLARRVYRIGRHGWCLAGKPMNEFGIAVVCRNAGVALGGVQTKRLFRTIKISRPVEAALNDPWLFIAAVEVDRVRALVLERTEVARARLVDGNALMRLGRRVMGLAFALTLLVGAGLGLLGGLLRLLGLLLGLFGLLLRWLLVGLRGLPPFSGVEV